MNSTVRSYLAELIGTFTLVFVGTSVATIQGVMGYGPAGWLGIGLAFGFTLMVLVWVLGPVSGCHLNPAVSLAMSLGGRLKWVQLPGYVVSQCVGAMAASGVLFTLLDGMKGYDLLQHGLGANGNPCGLSTVAILGWELVLTSLLVLTILSSTRSGATPGFAGLAIGGYLLAAVLVGAPLGGASLNPARSLGPAVLEGGQAMSLLWIYVAGPTAGGVLGLVLYRLIYKD